MRMILGLAFSEESHDFWYLSVVNNPRRIVNPDGSFAARRQS
jgi:hypothetical protein